MHPWLCAHESLRFFPESYRNARENWKAASHTVCSNNAVSATAWTYTHSDTGPDNETLGSDMLWLGPRQASRVLVLISGTHGVEGFVGSAIQQLVLSLFNSRDLTLPDDFALLFIHALNPWGFAWCRRCDEQGIDLNRNFVDFSTSLPANPDFARIRPWLYEENKEKRQQGLAACQQSMGQTAYEVALSGGQYVDSAAPFFGGTQPAHGRQVIERLMSEFELADRDLLVLDLHSGLGPWAYAELICDHPLESDGESVARRMYGAAVALPARGSSFSVPKLGLLDYAWHGMMNPRSCFLTLEFGSYGTGPLFDCLIDEHLAWQQGPPANWQQSSVRAQLVEHFCPADADWRNAVLFRSLQLVKQGIKGLSHD